MSDIDDVRAVLKENKAILGTERTLKLIKQGKVKKIFLAANLAPAAKENITHYSGLGNVQIVELSMNNEELGTLCKKPFPISVIGVVE